PLILQEPLDVLGHGPFEQELSGIFVTSEPRFDIVARWRRTNPHVARAVRAEGVADSALDVAHGAPACEVLEREARDLRFAPGVLVPELNTRPVVERDEHASSRGIPFESTPRKRQLVDHQLVKKARDIRARREPHPRPRLLERACAAYAISRLQDHDLSPSTGEI